ncbi:hypothetical protein RJT34_04168 [Clitoria ternatea]|uniref:Uncharacterized protein n=1 Tax=Clitoria ternatea TaxID=43366 RepID=A0AAN9KNK1_CLITE
MIGIWPLNDTHLKDEMEGVTNVIGIEFLETLSTITTLEKKSVAHGSVSELVLKAMCLASKDDERKQGEGLKNKIQLILMRVPWKLKGFFSFPTFNCDRGKGRLRWRVCGGWVVVMVRKEEKAKKKIRAVMEKQKLLLPILLITLL